MSATTTTAYRSVLGSVVKSASTIGTIFDVTSNSVDMLGNFVKEHADRQKLSHSVEREIFLETLEHDATTRLAEIATQAQSYCETSENHKKFYEAANSRIEAIIKEHRPSSNKSSPETSE